MTRMLSSVLAALLCSMLVGGCSLFSSDEELTKIEEIDSGSLATGDESGEEVLDAESEMLAEADDLGEELDESFPEDNLDSDSQEDDLDDFQASEFDSEEDEFSETNEEQVDQALAGDEFSDDSFGGDDFGDDEFEEEAQVAVIDEPTPNEPIVDVPEESRSGLVNEITNLEYKAFENGGTVVIETAQPASYQTIEDADLNQIIIQVNDVRLPQKFKRPYITKDFKQDIATINAYTDKATGAARFVIQLKRPIKPLVQKEGSSILVMTGDSSPIEVSPIEPPLESLVGENDSLNTSGTSMTVTQKTQRNRQTQVPFGSMKKSGLNLGSGTFTGDLISLEFTDTDIRTIIEVIADRSGVNLIMDKEVEGSTSIRLREVPWDQALQVLLRAGGLGYVKEGSVLRIAKQERLSQEAQAVSNQIKSEKEAKLLTGGLKVKYIPVSYANVNQLSAKLKNFVSKEGKIAFDDRTSSLVITDYGEYIERVIELVKALDTPPMQVEIAAKLVEAREEFTQEAGINWNLSGGSFKAGGDRTGSIVGGLRGTTASSGLSLDLDVGTFDIFGDLSATLGLFEQQDKIKVLSQPRTVTMNKTKAIIEQVTQIPIETAVPVTDGGEIIPSITYQDLKLSLEVTPQITFKGDVILDVDLKREFAGSQAANGNVELNKRHSKTTVMVKNGKTAVIGGIYQLDDRNNDTGVPWLKNIPLLGYLFKQTKDVKSKNELLLFLKPKILKEIDDASGVQMASPGSDYDPFEELSVDEGSNEVTSEGESLDDESFDESDFEEEGISL